MLKNLLRILKTSSCWYRLYKTDKAWDSHINGLLDNPIFEVNRLDDNCDFTILLNGYCIWVENKFYSYGHLYNIAYNDRKLPSRVTVFRLYDAVEKFRATL